MRLASFLVMLVTLAGCSSQEDTFDPEPPPETILAPGAAAVVWLHERVYCPASLVGPRDVVTDAACLAQRRKPDGVLTGPNATPASLDDYLEAQGFTTTRGASGAPATIRLRTDASPGITPLSRNATSSTGTSRSRLRGRPRTASAA
jgi:hypothetical protein